MPTHHINTIDDAMRIVKRYELNRWLGKHGERLDVFACWLYKVTRQVDTDDVVDFVEQYIGAREAAGPYVAEFDAAAILNAEDAMCGYRSYEKRASDLMWLTRKARTTTIGRQAWSLIASLALAQDKADVIANQGSDLLAEARRILLALKEIRVQEAPLRYVAGRNEATDHFMRLDIEHLDETLSDKKLWRDEENLFLPAEVSVLAQLVEDKTVLAMLDARLQGVLVVSPRVADGH